MPISNTFLESLECPHPGAIAKALIDKTNPKGGQAWTWRNEIRPVDLYCYLGARFGPPNGIQNFLREDDSDNFIHWEWNLACEFGWLIIQGMSFRTEVHLLGDFPFVDKDQNELIDLIKADFTRFGPQMSELKSKVLESWTEFINPYFRLRQAVDQLSKEIAALKLEPGQDSVVDLSSDTSPEEFEQRWNDVSARYSKGLGICFGIRSMLPVMAEAFINLLIFVLLKDDLKTDDRLRENVIRQPIDVRIKSLHHNCSGFDQPVDYKNAACRQYHSLVNERNDLLHGNVVIKKLQFNEVFFNGRVPVFKEYKTMWERSFGVEIHSVGLDRLQSELMVVDDLIEYVLSRLDSGTRNQVEIIMNTRDLGLNVKTGGIGILFPPHLVDVQLRKSGD